MTWWKNHEFPSARCLFLQSIKLHQKGLWKSECICGRDVAPLKGLSVEAEWNLQSSLCPCAEPKNPVSSALASWEAYYQWRSLPLHSPVAVLLHWPLTLYHCVQLSRTQTPRYDGQDTLCIHYLANRRGRAPDRPCYRDPRPRPARIQPRAPSPHAPPPPTGPVAPSAAGLPPAPVFSALLCWSAPPGVSARAVAISGLRTTSSHSPLRAPRPSRPAASGAAGAAAAAAYLRPCPCATRCRSPAVADRHPASPPRRRPAAQVAPQPPPPAGRAPAAASSPDQLRRCCPHRQPRPFCSRPDGEVVNISRYACCSDKSCCCKSSIGSKDLSCTAVTLKLWKGFYHERCSDILKDSVPQLIFAPNAGVAAYPSWMPTIEMIRQTGIPAIFTDFCEEAAHLASCCISSITGQPLKIPVCVRLYPGKSFQAASCSGKQCIIRTMLFKLLCFWDVKLPCHQEVYLEIDLSRNGM
ncbi:MYND finger family protein [Zea mays]|uniref:MYND finger family protein n=1 Tax=Zea mays TaxID=4577 RepID=A0A1D6IBI6_MAIZE|nr:MYND finger family protein [Zea mays]